MTYRTIGIEIDDAVYQRAVSKAVGESKTVNQVLAELLGHYAGDATTTSSTATPTSIITTTTVTPTPVQSVYVVQSGDTLGSIARKVYGNARLYSQIQEANNIQDPRRIWVGQKLVIPPLNDTTSTSPSATSTGQPVGSRSSTSTSSTSAGKNPRPSIKFVGSPNFNQRPKGEISAIVVHATANSSLQGVIVWFNNPDAQASAHYTIDKDGTIVQHVQDTNRAWHAGASSWQGRSNLNDWSLGIELVNWNNGEDSYPEAQHQANVGLVAYLCSQYNVKPELIVTHYDISPNRKTDPKGYDMDRLRREVAARL